MEMNDDVRNGCVCVHDNLLSFGRFTAISANSFSVPRANVPRSTSSFRRVPHARRRSLLPLTGAPPWQTSYRSCKQERLKLILNIAFIPTSTVDYSGRDTGPRSG